MLGNVASNAVIAVCRIDVAHGRALRKVAG
jgi:hypothetical protein